MQHTFEEQEKTTVCNHKFAFKKETQMKPKIAVWLLKCKAHTVLTLEL